MASKLDREPCPYRLVDDAGGGFGIGLVGGGIWSFLVGMKNAPSGQRLKNGYLRFKMRAPGLGGNFAVWGFLYSIYDCTFSHIRKKEDPWNAILAGAATGGTLAIKGGYKSAGRNALAGGAILAAMEGLMMLVSRVLVPKMSQGPEGMMAQVDRLDPPVDPTRRRIYSSRRPPSPLPFTPSPPPPPSDSSSDSSSPFSFIKDIFSSEKAPSSSPPPPSSSSSGTYDSYSTPSSSPYSEPSPSSYASESPSDSSPYGYQKPVSDSSTTGFDIDSMGQFDTTSHDKWATRATGGDGSKKKGGGDSEKKGWLW